MLGINGGRQYLLARGTRSDWPDGADTKPAPITAGFQNLFDAQFPSGRLLGKMDMEKRLLTIRLPGNARQVQTRFRYRTEGAHIMHVCVSGFDICGGTTFPMHIFTYRPGKAALDSREFVQQPNVMTGWDGRLLIAGYPDGVLSREKAAGTFEFDHIEKIAPNVMRPHALLVRRNGQVLMGGTPGYGRTGGGLLIWDSRSGAGEQLTHQQLIANHSIHSMTELSDGNILIGTTVRAGTGGASQASRAVLYLYNVESRQILWQEAVEGGVITDLHPAPNGQIYGIIDSIDLFVFDPAERKITSTKRFRHALDSRAVYAQGTRALIRAFSNQDRRENVYLLLENGVAVIDPQTHAPVRVATSPVLITAGGAHLDGRIYFGAGSRLYSWKVR